MVQCVVNRLLSCPLVCGFVSGALRWVTLGRTQRLPAEKSNLRSGDTWRGHHTRHLVPTFRSRRLCRRDRARFAFRGSRRRGLSGHARASPDRGFTTQCLYSARVWGSQPANHLSAPVRIHNPVQRIHNPVQNKSERPTASRLPLLFNGQRKICLTAVHCVTEIPEHLIESAHSQCQASVRTTCKMDAQGQAQTVFFTRKQDSKRRVLTSPKKKNFRVHLAGLG